LIFTRRLSPCGFTKVPDGVVFPFGPFEMFKEYVLIAKTVRMECGAVIEWNVCMFGVPIYDPSTITLSIWYPGFGVIVYCRLSPCDRIVDPIGEIVPNAPAVAVKE
jgi:hypothetical protein